MSEDKLIAKLKINRLMETREEVLDFEQSLAALASNPDVNLLPELFLIFDDDCKHHEVMWGLVHFIESFDVNLVIKTLVGITPKIIESAQEWVMIFNARILNNEVTRLYYKSLILSLTDENQQIIRNILTNIAHQSDDLKVKVDFVISKTEI